MSAESVTNQELMQQLATAFSSVNASSVVQIAAQNPQYKDALSAAIQQAATNYGLSFTPESAASLLAAAEQAGETAAALEKFKQHKDNPTQIPIGTPIALIFISAALLFLPSILSTTGVTIFGGGAGTAGPTGTKFQ